MKVVTSNPVIINNTDIDPQDWYMNASGATRRAKRTKKKSVRQKKKAQKVATKGTFGERFARGVDNTMNVLRNITTPGENQVQESMIPQGSTYVPPMGDFGTGDDSSKKGMSKGLKIGLIVGSVLVVGGLAYYFLVHKKKGLAKGAVSTAKMKIPATATIK